MSRGSSLLWERADRPLGKENRHSHSCPPGPVRMPEMRIPRRRQKVPKKRRGSIASGARRRWRMTDQRTALRTAMEARGLTNPDAFRQRYGVDPGILTVADAFAF